MTEFEAKKEFLDQMGWRIIPPCLMKYMNFTVFERTLYYQRVLRKYYTEEELHDLWDKAREIYDVKSLQYL